MGKDLVVLDSGRLNRERIRRGWDRKELAKQAKVSINSLRPALAGEPVGLLVARRTAAALGLQLRGLLRGGPQSKTGQAADGVAGQTAGVAGAST